VRQPSEKHVQAVSFVYDRKRWQVLDPAIQPRSGLPAHRGRPARWRSSAAASTTVLGSVVYVVDDGPVRYYLYESPVTRCPLPVHQSTRPRRAAAGPDALAVRSPVTASSWWPYYSLPRKRQQWRRSPRHPVPMVLIPHGGRGRAISGVTTPCTSGSPTGLCVLAVTSAPHRLR